MWGGGESYRPSLCQEEMKICLANRRKGFTLPEVMVALMVFAIAVLSLMGVYLTVSQLAESSRNLAQAMADARVVLEGIRETSTGGLAGVTGTNWTSWAVTKNLNVLNNESVTVTSSGADPLVVTVQVSWQERGRARLATVDTLVTRR